MLNIRFSIRTLLIAAAVAAIMSLGVKTLYGPSLNDRLGKAAERGDVRAVKWYLMLGADVNNGDWTPLMHASFRNHPNVVRFLIGRGADLDHAEYHDSYTALRLAEFKNHWDIAIILANSGASDHIDDGRDWYVINYARHAKREDVVDALKPWHVANGTHWEERQASGNPPEN